MEKEKPFKLFVPPRLSGGQVSAVKPQTSTRTTGLCQGFNKCPDDDLNLPFVMMSTPNRGEITDSDAISQQVKLCSDVDEENIETMNELYSKLYKEAEKIKRWKLTVESELKQKERKLQENRKIIEAQRKAIQELQFENEKLSLKLEDEICENKDLLKENSASRHLCNLLKETCTHFTEKSTKYEHEREETRQLYVELNNNVERMIMAFEELRVQAESTRLEMCFKLKEEAEKVDKAEKEWKLEVSMKEKQISVLTVQSDEKDDIIRDIKTQLQESRNKIADLVEAKRHEGEMLKESQINQEHLRAELEEAKVSLQKTEVTQKHLETELQTAVKALIQVTEEKEAQVEECEKTKALHASLIEEFETSISNLKSLLQREQNRLEKYEDESKLLTLELRNKSAELEEMTKLKCDKEMQLEELSETLGKVEGLLVEKKDLEATVENLQEKEKEIKNVLQIREKEIHDLKVQLTSTAEKEQNYLKQLMTLNTDLEREALKNEQLTVYINKLLLEKEQIAQEKSGMATELKKLQESHEDSRKKEENAKQLVENLEEANGQLRNELESLKEKMVKNGEEIKSKLDEREENAKSIENEISRKEKQLKILENKLNNIKKQVENKTKCIEELQQENKLLKKKITAESKKTSIYEGKVNKLQLDMENMNKQHKETVDIYQKDIETKKVNENKLREELEKTRLLADEATIAQRETDTRCQHKITEMVALMEKHKHEYDKMVEEKDAELKLYKIKEQEQLSSKRSLESELSCLKSELSSLKEQLKAEIEEKENLAKEPPQNMAPENEKKHKKIQTLLSETPKPHLDLDCESINVKNKKSPNDIPIKVNMMEKKKMPPLVSAKSPLGSPSLKTYIIKTPPIHKLQSESTNLHSEQCMRKKQKVLLQLDAQSDSSEHSDLLSIVSEEEMFKRLYKDYPQASQLYAMTPKKKPTSSNLKTPGSVLKLTTMRKMREAGWTAVSKMDRKRKIKEVEKLFT
ncbi:LOW QUALITY PROTEIN: synaptonemal complex protein 1 [Aquila chrysaetos chrysaetos]|uniref:LOW QUALITY PROTEIN: synaptonemal complex protein 1 n=1 Tax=Aquila chrysaetos chrysaetos TaxID=223781 RepID=UPI0005D06ACA|nr:LOW QUALITY PROTEIN: synaptonemal complex protein 1 [Aquila chrysaetos chrysaetos]